MFGTGLALTRIGGGNVYRLCLRLSLSPGDPTMKKTLFLLCLLCLLFSTAAFAQLGASYISNEPQIYHSPSHPAHASYMPMSQEQSVLVGTNYFSAQGERPLSEFPQPVVAVPLGTLARELRQQHDEVRKSRVVWVNQ